MQITGSTRHEQYESDEWIDKQTGTRTRRRVRCRAGDQRPFGKAPAARGDKTGGVLLITPRLNQKASESGLEPVSIDEAGLSIHPLLILEGERTPNRRGLVQLATSLSQSGSRVRTGLIDGLRGYFYLRRNRLQKLIELSRD